MAEQFTVTGRILFSTEGFERGITRASRKLRSFGQTANRAGRDLSTAVSLPLALAATAAIKTATSFELAQRKIQALKPTNNIEKLTKSARELGASTIFTAEEVSKLQLSLAKLGKSDKEIQDIQGTVLKFAQAMDQDLATSGEFLVKTMNRYAESLKEVGDAQEQAAYVGNLFAAVAANTALDAEKLANSLNYVGSEAAVYGITLEDTATILGLLADRGFEASRGGTALRRILAQLGKDGYTASEAIEELLDPTKGFSEELEKFGLRGAGPAAALGGLKDEFLELKETISGSNEFLNEFALVLDNSLSASFKRVKSAAQEVSIAFTTEFGDAIRTITDNIVRLLRGFADLPTPIKRIVVGLGSFLAIAGPLLAVIGALTAGIGALGFVLTATFGPAGVIVAGIATVLAGAATAMVLLTENTDATSMSMDELRRTAYEANEELRALAVSDLVPREDLEKVVSLQFEIEKLEKKLERLRSSSVGSSYNRQIESTTEKIAKLKDEQKKLNDEFREYLRVQDDINAAQKKAIEDGSFMGPVIPDFASDGNGGVSSDLGITLQSLLDQRQEILNRINFIKSEAEAGGLFNTEELKKQDSLLKEVEATLKLLGKTFDKSGKEKALPFTQNLIKEFERLNPEIAGIIGEQTRLNAAVGKLERVRAALNERAKEEFATQGFINEETTKSLVMNKAVLDVYKQQLDTFNDLADKNKTVGELLSDLNAVEVGPTEKELERVALLRTQLQEVQAFAMSIGNAFANIISNSIQEAVEGTKSFAEALGQGLVSALQRVLTKVLALIAAFVVLNILSGGAFAASGAGKAATEILGGTDMAGFVMQGLNIGNLRSGGPGTRVEGVLSGSDVVLSTRRGATALDRIYG